MLRWVVMLMLLVGASAFASDAPGCPMPALRCLNPELASLGRSGRSLLVEFPGGETTSTAILEDFTYSKEQQTRVYRRLAELPCKRSSVRSSPDSTETVLVCEDQSLADAGYVVELQGADIAGLQRVRVIERRFVGPVELANLPCGR